MATDRIDLIFKPAVTESSLNNNGDITLSQQRIRISVRSATISVSSIYIELETLANYIDTNANPNTPYEPLYPGDPTTKQYVDQHDTVVSATAPSSPTEGMVRYDTTNNQLKVYDGTNWNVTGKEYNAGRGIEIGTVQDYSAMKGPCSEGFHIPSADEWQNVIDLCDTILNDIWDIGHYLKMSFEGGRDWTDGLRRNELAYWACTCTEYNGDVFSMNEDVMVGGAYFANGLHIRPFSDTIHIPDNTRTTIYDASSVATGAGIFHNPTLGLISISDDGENWITISDKNVGATTVWNYGDTSTQENSGGFFQWGNNYMFPFTGTITTSTTKVDATGYGPGNYYSNNTFIKGDADWFTSLNPNLRGGVTGVVALDNAIINTGVLSVNGQTGHVTVSDTTYTAGEGISIDANNEISNTLPGPTIAATVPSSPTEGMLWYDTTDDALKVYDGTNWNLVGKEYFPGVGIYFTDAIEYDKSAMRGPCPEGFHIPTDYESKELVEMILGFGFTLEEMTFPMAGSLSNYNGAHGGAGSGFSYWTCESDFDRYSPWNETHAYKISNDGVHSSLDYKATGCSIRPFRDNPIIPDSDWYPVYQSEGGGVYYNGTLGLISFSSDGTNWITIADKNLGATQMYIDGDEYTADNCGGFFQRGNNYMFPYSGATKTSSTRVEASGYGPGNYYSSDTFIGGSGSAHNDRASDTGVETRDLRGYVTGAVSKVIGSKINCSTQGINTKTFYLENNSDMTTAQAIVDYYRAGNNPIIIYGDETYLFEGPIVITRGSAGIVFKGTQMIGGTDNLGGYSYGYERTITIYYESSDGRVQSISIGSSVQVPSILLTGVNYQNPYTPEYSGSPATKKYVDDSVSAITVPTKVSDLTNDSNFQTGTQVSQAISTAVASAYKYKGSVANYASLPASGNTEGDVWNVADTGMNYAWTGSAWDALGSTVDLSNYIAKDNTTSFTPAGDYNPATKKYVDDNVVQRSSTAPSNPTEGMLRYDTTNDVLKAYDGTNWNEVGGGAIYTAGKGISIGDVTINGRKGPSPDGFHVPSGTEWRGLRTIMNGLSLTTGDNWRINLHMPFAGLRRNSNASINNQGSYGNYWSSSPSGSSSYTAQILEMTSSSINAGINVFRAYGNSVRCFKDSYVTPDSTWTVIQGTLGSAGIFWNQSEGLISITNGTAEYTIMDKNLGATAVYNDGDTLSEANCGKYYQRGNNYGFPRTGSITTSSTQVNASVYGPTNPYSSDTFITGSNDWSSVQNDDLWGHTTGTYTLENVITNTGVLSVNGQTGDVTIPTPEESNTKTFYASVPSQWNTTLGQQVYDWIKSGNYAILQYGIQNVVIFTPTNTTTGSIYSQGYYTVRDNGDELESVATLYGITVSSGTVTSVDVSPSISSAGHFFEPSGTATTGYVVTKTANGYGWQAPTGGIQLAPNSTYNVKYHRYGPETDYANLSQYYTDNPKDTAYFTTDE